MFSSILQQETAFFDKTRTGELINRLSSDTALLGRSLTENLSDGLRAGAQASVGVGMMVWQSVPCLLLLVASSFFFSSENVVQTRKYVSFWIQVYFTGY